MIRIARIATMVVCALPAAATTRQADIAADPAALSGFAATALARPMFNPHRRPAQAALSARERTRLATLPRLTGMMAGPFGKRALLETDGRTSVVAEGGRAGAWLVVAIADRSVTLAEAGATTASPQRVAIGVAGGVVATRPAVSVLVGLPFWSTPCGRPHRRNLDGNAVADPALCRAALADASSIEIETASAMP